MKYLLEYEKHEVKQELMVQVLQTLYILIQNLRSKTALYYVCSNNHVNDLVTLPFDFEDEEVLGYYINLLKSISLQLTTKTAQFFFMVGLPSHSTIIATEMYAFLQRLAYPSI